MKSNYSHAYTQFDENDFDGWKRATENLTETNSLRERPQSYPGPKSGATSLLDGETKEQSLKFYVQVPRSDHLPPKLHAIYSSALDESFEFHELNDAVMKSIDVPESEQLFTEDRRHFFRRIAEESIERFLKGKGLDSVKVTRMHRPMIGTDKMWSDFVKGCEETDQSLPR